MAYVHATDQKFWNPIGGVAGKGKGSARYSFKTEDVHATVDTAGYFNELSDVLTVGDIIDVVVVTNRDASTEAVATYGAHIVLSNASGVVDVSNVTVGVVTDTD